MQGITAGFVMQQVRKLLSTMDADSVKIEVRYGALNLHAMLFRETCEAIVANPKEMFHLEFMVVLDVFPEAESGKPDFEYWSLADAARLTIANVQFSDADDETLEEIVVHGPSSVEQNERAKSAASKFDDK